MVFRGTQLHGNADDLSYYIRLTYGTRISITIVAKSPVTVSDIKKFTRRDPVLSQVLQFVLEGWPNIFDTSLSAYSSRKTESVLDGCLLWCKVIPPQCQQNVSQELHLHTQDEIFSLNVCLVVWS